MTGQPDSAGAPVQITPEVEALLLESLSLSPDTREAHLAQATDDPEVRKLVRELLAAHARGERRLGRLAGRLGLTASDTFAMPERAGAYRLQREIGRGGMSVVYLGCRDDGEFEQQVAVKLLAVGPGSEALVGRFEAERQLLARLAHPNIARLLDGGTTREGWPYLVMEYVDGIAITDYCDSLRLNVEERLRLFEQVLDAVQYAHRNLVVHRDIKPSNILVTGDGDVRLLDFGIAKVLSDDDGAGQASELTRLGGRPMTPMWASPEQIMGHAVTTASDVYALGALLYVLLCGRSPYRGELGEAEDLRRAILDIAPLAPSRRLEDSGDCYESADSDALAVRRATTVPRLRRLLRGDLDIICQVALRKEPNRRYATVEQLANDLARHRGRLPIRARADSVGYRLGKFARRHPLGLPAALVLPLLAIGALFVHTERLSAERDRAELEAMRAEAAAQRAERDARRAQATSDYLVDLFRSADPHFASEPDALTVMSLVERGVERAGELAETPDVQAAMLVTLGYVFRNLGETTRAVALMAEAVAVLADVSEDLPRERVDAYNALGLALAENGAQREAAAAFHEALALVDTGDELQRAAVLNNLAATLNALGEYGGAEAAHREGLEIRLRLDASAYEEALSRNNLGAVLWQQGRIAEALDEFEQALTLRLNDPDVGPEHPYTTTSMGNVAASLMALGRLDESYAMYVEALRLRRSTLGDDHPRNAALLHMMGQVRLGLDDIEGAERYWAEALEIRRARLPEQHRSIGRSLNAMARIALHREEWAHAETLLLEALEIKQLAFGNHHPSVADISANLAVLRQRQGRLDEARALLDAALEIRIDRLGPAHPRVIETKRQFVDLELAARTP
ncbi:MAG: serine/threonine protein kinase [Gammaproteobacteria bacterium]|nr:serine/threonine protein kinase [Gammaproteobacteria bacterium]